MGKLSYLSNDLFVLPSKSEQATVSVLDSMSYGLATITTSRNGTADYIKIGQTGDVFRTNDKKDLADKIEKYLINPYLSEQHGRKAVLDVNQNYSFESYYTKLIKIISSI